MHLMLAKCKEICSFSDHTKSRSFGSVVINLFVAITRLLVLSLLMNDNDVSWGHQPWNLTRYKENVVWTHGSTIAVLDVLGEKIPTVQCRLLDTR